MSFGAGQGASLALHAASVLADELVSPDPIPVALRRYEQRLRPLVRHTQLRGKHAAEWFVPSDRCSLEPGAADAGRWLRFPNTEQHFGALALDRRPEQRSRIHKLSRASAAESDVNGIWPETNVRSPRSADFPTITRSESEPEGGDLWIGDLLHLSLR